MSWLAKFLPRKNTIPSDDLTRPFVRKALEALKSQELNKAIAYLDRGLELVPNDLNLHLQRAQIFQYGLSNYTKALEGYRLILLELESKPNPELEKKCKTGMRDMMNPSPESP